MDINDRAAIQEKYNEIETRLQQAKGAIRDKNDKAAEFFISKAMEIVRAEQNVNEE